MLEILFWLNVAVSFFGWTWVTVEALRRNESWMEVLLLFPWGCFLMFFSWPCFVLIELGWDEAVWNFLMSIVFLIIVAFAALIILGGFIDIVGKVLS